MTTQTRRIPIKVRCKQAYHYRLSHKREDRNPKGEHCKKNDVFAVERIYKNWCLLENGYWLPIRMGKEILLIPENFDWYMVNVKPGVSYRYEPRADAKADADFPKQYELVAVVSQQEEWLQTWDNYWLPLCVNPDGQRRFLFILQRSEEVAYPDRLVVSGSSRPGLNGTYHIERVGKKLQLWMERPVWKTRGRKTKLFRWQAPHTEWVIDDELVNSPTVFACPENSEDVRHPGECRSVWMVFVQSLGDFAPDTNLKIAPEWDKDNDKDDNWEDAADPRDIIEEARAKMARADREETASTADTVAPLPIKEFKKLARGNSWILKGLTRPEKARRPGSPTATVVPPPPMGIDPFRRDDDLQSVVSVQPLPVPYRIKEEPESPQSMAPSSPPTKPPEPHVRHFPRSDFQRRAWGYLDKQEGIHRGQFRGSLREVARRQLAASHGRERPGLQATSPTPIFPPQSNGLYPAVGQLNSNAKVFSPTGTRRATNMQSLLDIPFQAADANKTNPLNLAAKPQFGPPLLSAANGFAGRQLQTQNGEGQRQPEGVSETLAFANSPTNSNGELSPFAKTFTSQGADDASKGRPKGPRPQRGKRIGQCHYRGQLCTASAIVGHPDEVYVDTFRNKVGRVVCHRVPRDSVRLVKST